MNRSKFWVTFRFLFVVILISAATFNSRGVIRDGGIDPSNLGKGDWLYSITDATNKLGGRISSVTNVNSLMLYYKSAGIRYLAIKAATGTSLFNGCFSSAQVTSSFVNTAHSNNILVFGYNRSYATNVAGEVAVADYVFNQGADGFIWDAEAEWESGTIGTAGPGLAWQQCSMVRSNWPNKFLAHAPFAIIGVHSTFPYKEFGFWCDAVMPQIYHFSANKGSMSSAISWTDVNFKSFHNTLAGLPQGNSNGVIVNWTNAIKPIAPLNDVYGPFGNSTCEGNAGTSYPDINVTEFMDYLTADPATQSPGGYNGMSFWRADTKGTNQWTNVKAGTSGTFSGQVNNIVIDNIKATTSGTWTTVQTWTTTTSGATYTGTHNDTNAFGTNYLVKAQGAGTAFVQYKPTVVVPGDYNVYEWHPPRLDADTAAPFTIAAGGITNTVTIDETSNGAGWNLLGRFYFPVGNNGTVRVMDNIASPSAFAIADGIKLVFVMPTSTPAAPASLNATPLSPTQATLNWTDNSTNESGYILSRSLTSGGPYTDIAFFDRTMTSYVDSGLAQNTPYYYAVRATNYIGASANSAQAAITLSVPSISTPPHSTTNTAGQNATFTVTAAGSQPLTYLWRFQGSTIFASSSPVLTVTNVQAAKAGTYDVVVTNAVGSITSAPATLTVNFSLTTSTIGDGSVTATPNLTSYSPGSSVTLTASPGSGSGFTGWSGDASGSVNPLTVTMSTNLSVTANFLLFPSFDTQPQSRAAVVGGTATFSAAASPAVSGYQWQLNGAPVSGGTASELSLSNLTAGDFGGYQAVAANAAGSATSSIAQLTIAVRPALSVLKPDNAPVLLSFGTEVGPVYDLQFATNLTDGWSVLAGTNGTGTPVVISDPDSTNASRFYRLNIR